MSVRATLRSPATTSERPAACASAAQRSSASRKRSFAAKSFPPFGTYTEARVSSATSATAIRVSTSKGGCPYAGRAGASSRLTCRPTPEYAVSPCHRHQYPGIWESEAGTLAAGALISWRQRTSGDSRSMSASTCASRARMPFTFHVAIFTADPPGGTTSDDAPRWVNVGAPAAVSRALDRHTRIPVHWAGAARRGEERPWAA